MKKLLSLVLVALLSVFAMLCNLEEKSLQVTKDSPAEISGDFQYQDSTVSFKSVTIDDTQAELTVTVDENILNAKVDVATETILVDGNNSALTKDQKYAMFEFAMEIQRYLDARGTDTTVGEYQLVMMTGYWSKAPEGYVYGKRSYAPEKGISANEGIKCIKKGTWVTAQYDDSRGDHSTSIQVGSTGKNRSGQTVANYACMGRCGPGCGTWASLASAWCKDCMDHDECSVKNNSSGGASDSNCGDEFNEAMDDWSFGVVRGCNGK